MAQSAKFAAVVLNKNLSIRVCTGTCSQGIPKKALLVEFYEGDYGQAHNENTINYFKKFNDNIDLVNVAEEYFPDYCEEALNDIKEFSSIKIEDNSNAQKLSNVIKLKDYIQEAPVNKLVAGQIVHFIDSDYHLGLLLTVGTKKSYMLMVTSSDNWNGRSRRITKDEFSLLGMPQRKISYFAPVSRPNEDITPTGITYPQHRLLDLIQEFK